MTDSAGIPESGRNIGRGEDAKHPPVRPDLLQAKKTTRDKTVHRAITRVLREDGNLVRRSLVPSPSWIRLGAVGSFEKTKRFSGGTVRWISAMLKTHRPTRPNLAQAKNQRQTFEDGVWPGPRDDAEVTRRILDANPYLVPSRRRRLV